MRARVRIADVSRLIITIDARVVQGVSGVGGDSELLWDLIGGIPAGNPSDQGNGYSGAR